MTEKPVRMAENEIVREALRLFPRLLRDQGYLLERGVLPTRGEIKLDLYSRRNSYRRPVGAVDQGLVESLRAKGWLEREGRRLVLSDAGSAWLRRRQAGAEPFREQHELRGTEHRDIGGGVTRPVTVNQAESPIAWLRRRMGRNGQSSIGDDQFQAAERLRSDFTRAQLMPRVTSAWDAGLSSRRTRRSAPEGAAGINDDALAAKQRFVNALEAVGPELSAVLVDVCCLLRGLEDTEKVHGWPRRSGKAILQIGLSALARHYGLSGGTGARGGRMRHWGAEDFRPTLEQWREQGGS